MSQENVEIGMRAVAAFNSRDVDAALHFFSPDAELQDRANAPDQVSTVKGTHAIREAWTLWAAAFDELRADIEEWTDVGDAVIGAAHWQGRGKASGMSIDVRQFDVYEFRDGRIVRATLGLKSKEEALEAAGLSESAMSQENVETLRAVYAGIATGDLSMLFELCDPNVEVTEPPEIPDSSSYRGHDGIRAVFGKLREVFPDMQFAAAEFVANGDRVLASMHWLGTGAGSGASARVPLFHVWSFEGGRATRIRAFLDREEALEAAGLSE